MLNWEEGNNLLGYSVNELLRKKAYITAKEICQQPGLWLETYNIIKNNRERIGSFLKRAGGEKIKRVILAGAGSSAFIGRTAVNYLNKKLGGAAEAIETTDIVSNPGDYLYKDIPTILVSLARSGNSPESVGTVNLAEEIIDNLYQIVITCNPDGELAVRSAENERNLVILMPEDSNDQGFAMTGSFTCMLLAVMLIFNLDAIDEQESMVRYISERGEGILLEKLNILGELAELEYDRVVFLGSAILKGIAQEASLKVLELTRGEVAAVYNSSLGFRHGPKSIVNDNTLVFSFLSDDPYTRKYEIDLLKEMNNNGGGKVVVAAASSYDSSIESIVDYLIVMDENGGRYVNDAYLALNYILIAQVFAILRSINIGVSPDNPSPDGFVNRIVKGVNIYPYK